MKRLLLPFGLAFLAITLALVAAGRLPDGALPVIVGVIAGVVASLPTSLIIVWRVTRAQTVVRPAEPPTPAERPPTVIVVPPAQPAPSSMAPAQAAAQRPQPGLAHETRRFTIIGGQDDGEA